MNTVVTGLGAGIIAALCAAFALTVCCIKERKDKK